MKSVLVIIFGWAIAKILAVTLSLFLQVICATTMDSIFGKQSSETYAAITAICNIVGSILMVVITVLIWLKFIGKYKTETIVQTLSIICGLLLLIAFAYLYEKDIPTLTIAEHLTAPASWILLALYWIFRKKKILNELPTKGV